MKEKIQKLINKLFHIENTKVKKLMPSETEKFLKQVISTGVVREFERELETGLNLQEVDNFYAKRLESEKCIYNFPLNTKLSESQTIELAKRFFSSCNKEISEKANVVIDGLDNRFDFVFEEYGKRLDKEGNPFEAQVLNCKEVYCPRKGDLRDLYGVVHEVSHTFDLKNGDTDARRIFGEVASQCFERLLDNFLGELSQEELEYYGFERETLIQDVRNRQISTFLSRKDNIKSFNAGKGIKELDLRYVLAQLYSEGCMKQGRKTTLNSLMELMTNIEENDIDSCSKAFGIELKNLLNTELLISDVVVNVKNTFNQVVLKEKEKQMLEKSKDGRSFIESFGNQDVIVDMESDVPFVLVTPSGLKDGKTLVMETNNLETNNFQELLKQALSTGKDLNDIFKGSNPILVPILPSKSSNAPYYQQLSAECFENNERPDLCVVDVINKAKEIMEKQYNVKVADKIFLNGYSASGCFAQRFSLIHPELIDTACIGGASGSIPIPNMELDYPLGVKNYEELFGKQFDIEEYKKINFEYYVGSLECETKASNRTDEKGNLAPMHDMSYFDRSVPQEVGKMQREKLGQDMFERAETTVGILRDMGIKINHEVIPDIAHNDFEAFELSGDKDNVQGIRSVQSQIIYDTFKEMERREREDEAVESLLRSKEI